MANEKTNHRRKRAPKAPTPKYSNAVQVLPGLWDVTFQFSLLKTDEDSGRWVVERHTSVTIPWTVAKVLIYTLTGTLAGVEHKYGPIIVPPKLEPISASVEQVGVDGVARLAMLAADLFPSGRLSDAELEEATAKVLARISGDKSTRH